MDYRYPIGKYEPQSYSELQKKEWLTDIETLPIRLQEALDGLTIEQLETPYRDGGWTVIQLVHHIADSHMNAYIRFKLGLTEENPTIKPYEEKEWAELADIDSVPISVSVSLIVALHHRWIETIKGLTLEQWQRTIVHPEHGKQLTLWLLLGMYAWHGKHHVAHITALRKRNNW